jgi:predicted transcriptional regulator
MKYRSRVDIMAAILEIAKEGSIKTRIMFGASLSFTQLKEYTNFLIEQGLMERSEEATGLHRTTEKGLKFLHRYREIDRMIPEANMLTKVMK